MLKAIITQGMLEDFEAAISAEDMSVGLARFRGKTTRAAAQAGWLEGEPDLEDPGTVRAICDAVTERYQSLLNLDPHPNGGGKARPRSTAKPAAD